ncbi:MAG: TVP38/TMEM64 family protein [Syntrophomonadaceae bacterium]|jgi:uncharacterized membrane protein YdjX (TVP38/TMEM64 family)
MGAFHDVGSISIEVAISYVQSFGLLAPLAAFGLFVIQAALPVFPYIVLASACGLLFGFKLGFILSWSGALCGACLSYVIFRWAGGNWARERLLFRWGYDINHIDREAAFWSILLARVIPIIPTPVINVLAGVGKVPFWNFFFSSALGKIPTALLYTGLGVSLFRNRDIESTLLILSFILILAVAGRYLTKGRRKMFVKMDE